MTIIYTVVALSAIGTLAAVILYFVARKFKVYEDPRIDQVEEALPGANCGGCGYAGCRAFAEACVKENELSSLFCPVGGNDCMGGVADILGLEAVKKDPRVAVVRCNGTCEHRPKTNHFDGAPSCAVAASLYSGDTGCQYGCLGCGDCVTDCDFDAIHMNPETGLPEVDDEKCVACGACVEACPKTLIELRKKGPKNRRIYVSCRNEDKGGVAKKSCEVACIGCSKCFKVCPFDAITMNNNLAYINSDKCKLCRKCVVECPTNAIIEENFPPRKIKADLPPKPAPKTETVVKTEAGTEKSNKPDNIEK
ncbi:MAG TPA: Fe-S cluster domain-containing protein [Sunxiuqinia sp.]|nr:Fe-S cluster domain-containing protein [Sunxiuqinia sp.]